MVRRDPKCLEQVLFIRGPTVWFPVPVVPVFLKLGVDSVEGTHGLPSKFQADEV